MSAPQISSSARPAGHGDAAAAAEEAVVVMDAEASGNNQEEEDFIDYDDHEAWELDEEDVFLMLKNNDSKLTMLDIDIGGDSFAHRVGWGEEGACLLQNNTHLKYLGLRVLERNFLWEETEEEAAARELCTSKICRAIAKNRTIQHLRLDFDHTNVDMAVLEPFIALNDKLRRISMSECTLDRKQADHFISALTTRRNKESFVRIDFHRTNFGQLNENYDVVDGFGEAFSEAFLSLMATSGYRKLTRLDLPCPSVGAAAYVQLSTLLANPLCKLKSLELDSACAFDDECMGILANAISKNCSLKEIALVGMGSVSAGAWHSFSAAFAGSGIEKLQLSDRVIRSETTLCSEKALVVGEMLASATRLRVVRVKETMHQESWKSFFRALQNPALEELDISGCNSLGEKGIATLGEALASNPTLRVLGAAHLKHLPYQKPMTPRGWQLFFGNIGDAGKMPLEKLDIGASNVFDKGVAALSYAFANSKCLKILLLSSNNISCAGVRALLGLLANNTVLEHLDLGGNRIGDEGATALSAALASNSRLKVLRLMGNGSITTNGRQSFLTLLQNPNTSLERLILGGETASAEEIVAFVTSLANNTTLKELQIGGGPRQESNTLVSDALLRLLCNNSSFEATFASNHTLECFWVYFPLSDCIHAHLNMNRNDNKFQVARQKILQTHFSEKGGIQAFIEMELKVLPQAIHWLAVDVDGHSLIFQLLRSLPALTGCRRSTKQTPGTKRKLGV